MSGPKRGLVRSLYEGALDVVMGKQTVGKDAMGNVYLRWHETQQGAKVERREVRWSQPYMLYDPHAIPSEWRMWLRKLRDQPPTEQEIDEGLAKAAALKRKVAVLDEAERQRRIRQAAQGAQAQQPGAAPPDMSRLLQQVNEPHAEEQRQHQSTDATGSGESFKPGTWQPGR